MSARAKKNRSSNTALALFVPYADFYCMVSLNVSFYCVFCMLSLITSHFCKLQVFESRAFYYSFRKRVYRITIYWQVKNEILRCNGDFAELELSLERERRKTVRITALSLYYTSRFTI